MKHKIAALLIAALLINILFGCGKAEMPSPTTQPTAPTEHTVVETLPPVPEDGDPDDVTCKGTYTGAGDQKATVAEAAGGKLTNGELQVWYWAAVASYREANGENGPDFDIPLDRQSCTIDSSVNSWQQYFLRQALNAWHTAQTLYAKSLADPLPVEEAFAPYEHWRAEYMVDIPAMKYLYRENPYYAPNTMDQAFLDDLGTMLDEIATEQGYADADTLAKEAFGTSLKDLQAMAHLLNYAYFYHINESYYIETTATEVEEWFVQHEAEYQEQGITRSSGFYVDLRQILLVPQVSKDYPELTVEVSEDGVVTCDEVLWEECKKQAETLIKQWKKNGRPMSEGTFSDLAAKNSLDTGSAVDGGAYRRVSKGQMIEPIDAWCFDSEREPKDYEVIRTEYGVHILYYAGAIDIWEAESEEDLLADKQKNTILETREASAMTVTYSAISLTDAQADVSLDRLLYGDVAHERFPEVPLYLQQDYGHTMYGGFLLRTNGCGITSFAMLSSYMMDDELTPPEMCEAYGRYSSEHGTDVTLMMYEPQAMGFYVRRIYDEDEGLQALKDGHIVISVQTPGYWTRAGHYIVVEKLNEDGTVQVRDSNIFNYSKLEGHKQDKHTWESVTKDNKTMWIIEKKLTHVPICSRCGDHREEDIRFLTADDYICQKCRPAILRRNTYLSMVG